ncbi:hypothetical protein Avbf_08098 [Armadillidium vulgare]|nr:hypothetical protein Avbf_08098 [Armadillidium vulgare]
MRSQLCIPVGIFKDTKGMDDWCRINCLKHPPLCPPDMCICVHDCVAVGEFAKLPDADIFCHQNCLKYPSYCPEERCKCS